MRAAWALLTLLLAGCVDAPAAADEPIGALAPAAAAEPAPLGLAATSCFEGGGHSVHPKFLNPLPDRWTPADVLDDVGPQLLYSEVPDPTSPVPRKGNTIGNYHASVFCEGWTLDGEARPDMIFGFVGMKVEAPTFDPAPEGVTHHYLVTVIATNDAEVLERLHAGGVAALHATAARVAMPAGAQRIQMWTDGNGEYDTLVRPKPMGDNKATHVRLWWQGGYGGHGDHAEVMDESGYRPIALDLITTGGSHLVADGPAYFSHAGTDHHWPLPGAHGQTAALMYEGFDRAFAWGPRPDVTLREAYDH